MWVALAFLLSLLSPFLLSLFFFLSFFFLDFLFLNPFLFSLLILILLSRTVFSDFRLCCRSIIPHLASFILALLRGVMNFSGSDTVLARSSFSSRDVCTYIRSNYSRT